MSFDYNGLHLMIDATVKDTDRLAVPEAGIAMLEKIVEKIDMTMILPPVTVKFPHATCEMQRVLEGLEQEGLGQSSTALDLRNKLAERKNESYGYSTFVMIAESHLTIHTFPELQYFSFDCYSCKGFDAGDVIEVIHSCFDVEQIDVHMASRRVPALPQRVTA
tara:strand:- start:44 stop:532 length:489 start_codon:yes stop_codon:yes gene_type:complete